MESFVDTVIIVFLAVGIPIAGLVALIVLPIWFKERTKQSAHKLLSEALARGEKIDTDVIAQLSSPPERETKRPRRTLGSAVILLALALAMGASAYFTSESTGGVYAWSGQMTAAAILGALGLAFLILAIVDYNSNRSSPDA